MAECWKIGIFVRISARVAVVENHHFTKWRTSVDRLKNENFHMEKSNSRNHAVVLATDGSGSGQVYNSNYVSRSVI